MPRTCAVLLVVVFTFAGNAACGGGSSTPTGPSTGTSPPPPPPPPPAVGLTDDLRNGSAAQFTADMLDSILESLIPLGITPDQFDASAATGTLGTLVTLINKFDTPVATPCAGGGQIIYEHRWSGAVDTGGADHVELQTTAKYRECRVARGAGTVVWTGDFRQFRQTGPGTPGGVQTHKMFTDALVPMTWRLDPQPPLSTIGTGTCTLDFSVNYTKIANPQPQWQGRFCNVPLPMALPTAVPYPRNRRPAPPPQGGGNPGGPAAMNGPWRGCARTGSRTGTLEATFTLADNATVRIDGWFDSLNQERTSTTAALNGQAMTFKLFNGEIDLVAHFAAGFLTLDGTFTDHLTNRTGIWRAARQPGATPSCD